MDGHEEGALPLQPILGDPLGVVRRRWRWMSAGLVLGLGAAAAFVWLRAPVYRAEATVLVTSQQVTKEFVRPTIPEDSLTKINAMLGEILSREALGRMIERYDLYPDLRDSYVLAELADGMRRQIQVSLDRGIDRAGYEASRVLRLSFSYDRPEVAAEVATALAALFTQESIRSRTEQARLTTEFLRRELEGAERALRAQAREITEFKQGQHSALAGDLHSSVAKLDRLQLQRQTLALQIAEAETRLASLASGMLEAGAMTPDARLAALRADLEEQRAINTEQHPDVVALRHRVEALEAELGREDGSGDAAGSPSALMASARRTVEELRAQLAETQRTIEELDARVAAMPALQEELAALQQREGVLRETYLAFLRKVQDAELAQSLESAQQGMRFSVLDEASPPPKPERSRLKWTAAGVALSLLLAAAIGIALEILDPVLIAPGQIEAWWRFPVLGSAPRVR